jgi:hypothetical protein
MSDKPQTLTQENLQAIREKLRPLVVGDSASPQREVQLEECVSAVAASLAPTPQQAGAATGAKARPQGVRTRGIRLGGSGDMQLVRGAAVLSELVDIVRRFWTGVVNPLRIRDGVKALIDLLKLPIMVVNSVHTLTEDEGYIVWLLACDPDVERTREQLRKELAGLTALDRRAFDVAFTRLKDDLGCIAEEANEGRVTLQESFLD